MILTRLQKLYPYKRRRIAVDFILLISMILALPAQGDVASAQAAMENPANPLMLISTSQGNIYFELFNNEAPNNVANIMALAEGEVEFTNPETGLSSGRRYYNGMRFHRVISDFVIQTGSPAYHTLGAPEDQLRDEVNADFLGLQEQLVLRADGSFNEALNITSKEDFDREILEPLYRVLSIESASEILANQSTIVERLQEMTLKRAYENQGYRYSSANPSHGVLRGVIALANSGPNTNGPEFFISLQDAPWLTGKHTVIGKVVEGIEVADTIGATPIDPIEFSRLSTLVYSIRKVN